MGKRHLARIYMPIAADNIGRSATAKVDAGDSQPRCGHYLLAVEEVGRLNEGVLYKTLPARTAKPRAAVVLPLPLPV